VNREAPELSPEARRLISDARGVDDPTAEDQARVKARWLASVAAVAGVSSLTEAARAAGGIGWGLKAAGAALVLAAGTIGLYVALPPGTADEAKRAAAPLPAWSGTTHDRHEKTPAGEHQALTNQPAKKLDDGVAPAPVRPPPSGATVDSEAFAVPVVVPPPVVPLVQAASPAPSVLEPAEVPTREGVALDVGVEAPATEATVAVRQPVVRPAVARVPRRQRPGRAGNSATSWRCSPTCAAAFRRVARPGHWSCWGSIDPGLVDRSWEWKPTPCGSTRSARRGSATPPRPALERSRRIGPALRWNGVLAQPAHSFLASSLV
jgi:hypothetical protein